MVGVLVAFIRVVYGRMIYMSLPNIMYAITCKFACMDFVYFVRNLAAVGQRYINITRNAIGPKSGQKDCRKF